MPRFFFHVHDEDCIIVDEEGTLCEDLEAAKKEAIASALDLAKHAIGRGGIGPACCIEIHDESGKVVAGLRVLDALTNPVSPRFTASCASKPPTGHLN
jgi:Domain of unknown function (DUF6894)